MNKTQQQIAIAKACGWLHTKTIYNPNETPYGRHPIHTADVNWDLPLPDYLNDLNAMHEAEKVLKDNQVMLYAQNLGFSIWHYHKYMATAAERAEAFLRTLNLWTP
jgi:hypothetical protein